MKNYLYAFIFLYCFLFDGINLNTLKSQTIQNTDTLFNLSAKPNDSITIHYIGCSGFFIRKGNKVVVTDPYFSNKKASTFLFGTLTNKANIEPEVKSLMGSVFFDIIKDSLDHSGLIKALLISHAHVDHYGDVPYLFHNRYFNQDTLKIIGSTTTQYYLGGDEIPEQNTIRSVENSASTVSAEGKWIYVNNGIRVLPIIGEHPAHLQILGINIHFVPKKNEKKNIRHKYWRKYTSGQTLCYLIDFLNDDGSINFRIYFNSSGSNSPLGLPAQSVLKQHPVDIAMVCVASYNLVKNYPEDMVRYLKPAHIITSHWEDFLNCSINELKIKPKDVPANNINKFFKRLDKVILGLNSGTTYIRPNVNTTIDYFYSNTKK